MKENKDWMNPDSEYYYNGFEYEEYENGDKFWSDKDFNVRKRISFYSTGKKYYESFFNENEDYHNKDGYAYIEWDEDGNIKRQQYYLNGEKLTEDEWLFKTNKITQENMDYLNKDNPNYYKGFRYEKDKYNNDNWYDENNVCRKKIAYHKNGNVKFIGYFNRLGQKHNEYGLAHQRFDEDNLLMVEYYYINGNRLTEEQWKDKTDWKNPISINYYKGFRFNNDYYGNKCWYDENDVMRKEIIYRSYNNIFHESFFNEKGEYHNEDGPAYVEYNYNNEKVLYEYWINGKKIKEESIIL